LRRKSLPIIPIVGGSQLSSNWHKEMTQII
jgi:hypothetical protein